jgi:hypothetical protein
MAKFSNRTITELGDVFAAQWTVRTIERLFEDYDIEPGPEPVGGEEMGVRRAVMRRYLASLNLDDPVDTAKLGQVMDEVLSGLHSLQETDPGHKPVYERLRRLVQRDGFRVDQDSGHIVGSGPAMTDQALSALSDPSAIREHLHRLTSSVDSDPRLAVSVAKDLVESTAKLVLTARKVPYSAGDGVPHLVARAQESLGLAAKGVEGSGDEAKALKAILGSLANLAQGVTELRNKVGVGHGRESVPDWVRPRHARLASGAAQTWCQLMLETLEDPQAPWRTSGSSAR